MLFCSKVESSACISGFKFHMNHTTMVLCTKFFVCVFGGFGAFFWFCFVF